MKAIVTVIGHDQVGIVAQVSEKLADLRVNITDMSQTLLDGEFTMMLMGEWDDNDSSFESVQTALTDLGRQLKLDIRIQRRELFDAIQKL